MRLLIAILCPLTNSAQMWVLVPKSFHELYSCKLQSCTFAGNGGGLCEADSADICKADDSELASACSQMTQLPPRFIKASHTARTFVLLVASLLKVKKLQPSTITLLYNVTKTGVTFLRRTTWSLAQLVAECHSFHPALMKFSNQQGHSSSLLHPNWRRKSSTLFRKTTNFLSIALLQREVSSFTHY